MIDKTIEELGEKEPNMLDNFLFFCFLYFSCMKFQIPMCHKNKTIKS